ncbi:MAG: hypothetical protein J6A59_01210 [Lachnospiraceae bacterium]|nr:hypothetical protein [Lachnospiraceae bacterium]
MAVGINLTSEVRVELGEIREQLLHDLDLHKINYEIPFDKLNKEGIKETIIHIKEIGTEISIDNDIITYIKMGNTEFTKLAVIEDIKTNMLSHIKDIQEHVTNLFNLKDYIIKIEKIDTETMNITIIIYSKYDKARVQILRDSFGVIYINTLRTIA